MFPGGLQPARFFSALIGCVPVMKAAVWRSHIGQSAPPTELFPRGLLLCSCRADEPYANGRSCLRSSCSLSVLAQIDISVFLHIPSDCDRDCDCQKNLQEGMEIPYSFDSASQSTLYFMLIGMAMHEMGSSVAIRCKLSRDGWLTRAVTSPAPDEADACPTIARDAPGQIFDLRTLVGARRKLL